MVVFSFIKNIRMILVIDIGNTRTKAAVFEGNKNLEQISVLSEEIEKKISTWVKKFPNIRQIVTSSVGKPQWEEFLKGFGWPIFKCDAQTKYPFVNKYSTPNTIGIDRLVLASGSVLSFPSNNRLIIDAGTCITYDFVTDQNEYLGGGISPGLGLRYKALNNYTARLPLLEKSYPDNFIGDSTANAIHSGVTLGAVHEIDGFISSYGELYPNFITILTGGDSEFLANRLKNTIFANPNFLMESLYKTYQFALND